MGMTRLCHTYNDAPKKDQSRAVTYNSLREKNAHSSVIQ
jgi:hypothetical protein